MAAWTTLDTNTLLPGEPLTSAKALAFYENPIAQAEGASGAPKIASEALGLTTFEGQDSAGTVVPVVVVTVLNLDRVATLHAFLKLQCTAGAGQLRLRTSTDNGSTWSAYSVLLDADDATVIDLTLVDVDGKNAVEFSLLLSTASSVLGKIVGFGIAGVAP